MSKPWVVCKFGGTSVATVESWGQIVNRVRTLSSTNRVWLVVSAVSKVTNALIMSINEAVAPSGTPESRLQSYQWVVDTHVKLALSMNLSEAEFAPVRQLLDELRRILEGLILVGEVSYKLRAKITAYGELLSSQLGNAFLRRQGFNCTRVDSRMLLTSRHGDDDDLTEADMYLEADVAPSVQIDAANSYAGDSDVVICQGFIAKTPSGATCLLGRGGSDTSGALFAALIGAVRCEIWTDVNGMFSADPRYVKQARLIRSLTYREAQELAAMGAKVLHPRCLLPAAFAGIPVEIRNTMDPSDNAEITTVSPDGLDYLNRGQPSPIPSPKFTASPAPTRPRVSNFTEMPPARSPSPSSHIIFTTAGGENNEVNSESIFTIGDLNVSIDATRSKPSDSPLIARDPVPSSPSSTSSHSSSTDSLTGKLMQRSLIDEPTPFATPSGANVTRTISSASLPQGKGLVPTAGPPKVLAVARRKGTTLITLAAYDMWGNSGFLSRVFAPFAQYGVSVDLIATSQYSVSLTLDHIPGGVQGTVFKKVLAQLERTSSVEVRYPCAVVSVVGRSLRNALPEIGAAMRVLRGVAVHMVSEASEDLNMSFVVDEEWADSLVEKLHHELLEGSADIVNDRQFGPCWTDLPCGKKIIPGEAKH